MGVGWANAHGPESQKFFVPLFFKKAASAGKRFVSKMI
jgi:hypothetical protein